MAGKKRELTMNPETKQLAILVNDFLLNERDKKGTTKKAKRKIYEAVNCLEKVYNIRFTDYLMPKFMHSLPQMYVLGRVPTRIKDRLAAEVHKCKGNEFMDVNLYKLAEAEYTKALELDPRNAIYFCNRAACKIRQGDVVSATDDCNRALELDRYYAKAYCWLGIAHALMDHPGRAIRCYRKALRIEPDNAACQANMDLINRGINRISLKVFEPLYRYSRSLVRMASNMTHSPAVLKQKGIVNADLKKQEKRAESLQKYALGILD